MPFCPRHASATHAAPSLRNRRVTDAQVQQFFAFYHPGAHYRVYNLCEERVYEGAALGGMEHPVRCAVSTPRPVAYGTALLPHAARRCC